MSVSVVATRNFGQELIFSERVELAVNTRAMDALQQVAEVETAYGGGFVNAINDIRSDLIFIRK